MEKKILIIFQNTDHQILKSCLYEYYNYELVKNQIRKKKIEKSILRFLYNYPAVLAGIKRMSSPSLTL